MSNKFTWIDESPEFEKFFKDVLWQKAVYGSSVIKIDSDKQGKMIMTSTPYGPSDFAREYLGEFVNDRSNKNYRPEKITTMADLEQAVRVNMTDEEILERCAIIALEEVKILLPIMKTEAWRVLYE